ncbi:barstar family protein [uncultured Psychrobacter sp.]|uniref:barstar family protein n=1 Tax=uncultured Psychrobacter sp. TaxID=259303 RepID=UPI003459F2FA
MSNAIHYINKNHAELKATEHASIPEQAINIVVGEVLDKASLLIALDNTLSFPDYFAHNWDSAWDCLTDSDAEHLRLDLTDVQQINNEDFEVFKSMIEDAYRDFGRPQLWVVG